MVTSESGSAAVEDSAGAAGDGVQRLELVTVGCADGMVVWGQIFE